MTRFSLLGGALGSAAFTLYAGRHSPPILMVLFTLWVLSPFAMLWAVGMRWQKWASRTHEVIHAFVVVVSVASIIVYGFFALTSPKPATRVFVLVPPATWVLIAIVVLVAALRARR